MTSEITLWTDSEQLSQVKKIFAPKITELEFTTFVEMGKATGLNPFLKEIWAVKYGESPAQIFIGRDGYRKSAQRHSQYDSHFVDAVYSNDFFEGSEGSFIHKYNLKDRGSLVGAYCMVYRKGASKPISLFVDFREYNKGQSVWKEKPATMIKKVAESQALRMAFQELFSGTYDESEAWDVEHEDNKVQTQKKNNGHTTQLPKLPAPPTSYLNFGESNEDKVFLKKIVVEIAPTFNVDPSKDVDLIKTICRETLNKSPTVDGIEEVVSKTFEEIVGRK